MLYWVTSGQAHNRSAGRGMFVQTVLMSPEFCSEGFQFSPYYKNMRVCEVGKGFSQKTNSMHFEKLKDFEVHCTKIC